jgi:hypothetical protein
MKNLKKIIFVVGFLVSIDVSSQNLKQDCNFIRSTTYLLSTVSYLDDFMHEQVSKEEALKAVILNLRLINKISTNLEFNHSEDEDYKTYRGWVDGISKSIEFLKENNDSWMLMSSLIKLDINDFLIKKYDFPEN